ncbi:hypothetical protein ACFL0Y_04020 [Patescibacteria group bacterium]
MKKYSLIAIAVVLILVGLGAGGYFLLFKDRGEEGPVEPPKQEGKLIETTLAERPYVSLTPRADGKEFTLAISRIKNVETIEYELVYLAGDRSSGVIGSIDYKGEESLSRDLLLGTCSRNVCKYDEGVEEGTLTLIFRSEEGVRKFTSDFHLQQGEDELISQDGSFSISANFPASSYYLTMSTIGLPAEFDKKVVMGPYGVFTAGSQTVKAAEVGLSFEAQTSPVEIYAWPGDDWEMVDDSVVEDNEISAETDKLMTFLVSASEVAE